MLRFLDYYQQIPIFNSQSYQLFAIINIKIFQLKSLKILNPKHSLRFKIMVFKDQEVYTKKCKYYKKFTSNRKIVLALVHMIYLLFISFLNSQQIKEIGNAKRGQFIIQYIFPSLTANHSHVMSQKHNDGSLKQFLLEFAVP
ncbi:unnamed protein product [Paramecium sonneborni]|uniref:Transmembrane protein n=1 Tax=Paramecium sonneborni TaxID=65129 RepID=A0A8S1QYJ7_9CILI|nr:unnamed protein product [Paramecium sonneborni]